MAWPVLVEIRARAARHGGTVTLHDHELAQATDVPWRVIPSLLAELTERRAIETAEVGEREWWIRPR